jgi:hypothetical protein
MKSLIQRYKHVSMALRRLEPFIGWETIEPIRIELVRELNMLLLSMTYSERDQIENWHRQRKVALA